LHGTPVATTGLLGHCRATTYLLKTLVDITWPLDDAWSMDLFALVDGAPDLGETLDEGDEAHPGVVRPPGTDDEVVVE
jgi:hypothetical protein